MMDALIPALIGAAVPLLLQLLEKRRRRSGRRRTRVGDWRTSSSSGAEVWTEHELGGDATELNGHGELDPRSND